MPWLPGERGMCVLITYIGVCFQSKWFLCIGTCIIIYHTIIGYCQCDVFLHVLVGNSGEGIDEIHKYERDYFARSKLFQ